MFALKLLTEAARLAEYRLPPGRRQARSRARPRDLSVQFHHRRHRPGRRDPSRRHRSAPRGARAQCAHPQALAPDQGKLPIGLIGEDADLTYAYDYLGAGAETLAKIADGSHPFVKKLEGAERPMLILGQGGARAARRRGGPGACRQGRDCDGRDQARVSWNGFNVLHTAAARVGGLDLGFVPGKGGLDVEAILDAAGEGTSRSSICSAPTRSTWSGSGSAFVIYQGSHGDAGAHRADVILPGAAYTEKDAIYVNTEGRPQMTARAVFPPGEAREDWKIVRALVRRSRQDAALRHRRSSCAPRCSQRIRISLCSTRSIPPTAPRSSVSPGSRRSPARSRFGHAIDDFYLTNPIARASAIMASLSALHAVPRQGDRHRWLSSGRATACRSR